MHVLCGVNAINHLSISDTAIDGALRSFYEERVQHIWDWRMSIYQSEEQIYQAMQTLFERILENPANIETFTQSNLVIRMKLTNPSAQVLLDGRQPPLEVFYGERPGKANIEIQLETDLLHKVWMGDESTSDALFSGKIKTQGNLLKARQLIDLFMECERHYPEIAREVGVSES